MTPFKIGDLVTWASVGEGRLGLVLSHVDDFGNLKCVVRFLWIDKDGRCRSYTGKYYPDTLKLYGT